MTDGAHEAQVSRRTAVALGAGRARRMGSFAARLLCSAPDRIAVVLFWTALVVSLTVLAGQFRPVVVAPSLIVVIIATWRLTPSERPATTPNVLGALAAVIAACAWLIMNVPYASRFVVVTRDPGFLTLQGLWLTTHASPQIPVGSALEAQDLIADAHVWTGAFPVFDGYLYAQGAKLLPGLLALGGWFTGPPGVLAGNLVIGAVGLLAVYAFSRRLVGPWWALLPMVALGASMPMIAFSRAAYTEPLTMCLVFAGLTMSWSAFETRTWWRHALAGAMIGATALARIDGPATAIGLVAGMGLVAAAPLAWRQRSRQQAALAAAGLGAAVMVLLGYVDLRWNSPGYLADLADELTLLTVALTATAVAALVLTLPRRWNPLRQLVLHRRSQLGWAAVAAVSLAAIVLLSRSWWLPGQHTDIGSAYAQVVGGLQEREGLAIDPSRSYDDWSVRWLAWYYGWPMVGLGFAGLAILGRRAVALRDPRSLVTLAVIGAPSLLYLWRVSITPDQVWALRRFLPVTIPGFLVAATLVLSSLWAHRRLWARSGAVVLALAVAAHPWSTWGPLFTVPEHEGRLGEVDAVCAAIGSAHVLYVEAGGPPNYLASIRVVCDVETIRVTEPPTASSLATLRAGWSDPDLVLVTFDAADLPWADGVVPPALRTTTTRSWRPKLSGIPSTADTSTSSVWVATIHQDGTLSARSSAG